jgi:hypothetical protein
MIAANARLNEYITSFVFMLDSSFGLYLRSIVTFSIFPVNANGGV